MILTLVKYGGYILALLFVILSLGTLLVYLLNCFIY